MEPTKRLVRNNSVLFSMSRSFVPHGHVAGRDTKLCIEGPPRCANTFIAELLAEMSPGLEIARHTHCPAGIRIALGQEVPTVILIREPLDAIASIVQREEAKGVPLASLDYLARLYSDIYDLAYRVRSSVLIVDFSYAISQTGALVRTIAGFAGLSTLGAPDDRVIRAAETARAQIRARNSELTGTPFAEALPNQAKSDKRARTLDGLRAAQSMVVAQAQESYTRLLPFALTTKGVRSGGAGGL